MSYQYSSSSGSHRLNEFVPNYVPKSEYLPSRVVETNQSEANQWVPFILGSSPTTRDRNSPARFTLRDPLSSTLTDMSQ